MVSNKYGFLNIQKKELKIMIKKCTCEHKYQDEKYGKGNRVHNELASGKGHRCTVCEKIKT